MGKTKDKKSVKVDTADSKNYFNEGGPNTMGKSNNADVNSALEEINDLMKDVNEQEVANEGAKVDAPAQEESNEFDKELNKNIDDNNNSGTGAKTSTKKTLSEATQRVIGKVNTQVLEIANSINANLGYKNAREANTKHSRIIGYVNKTDARNDFVKKSRKNSENTVTSYEVTLKSMPPSPVSGVIISSPAELTQLILTNAGSTGQYSKIAADEVAELSTKKTRVVRVLPKVNHTLHNALSTQFDGYVVEDESLFVPHHKIKKKTENDVEVVSFDRYEADPTKHKAAARTDNKPGIYADIKMKASNSATKATDNTSSTEVDITSTTELTLVAVLANTARPRLGLAPGNYISETRHASRKVSDIIADIRADSSKSRTYTDMYFKKWIDPKAPTGKNAGTTPIALSETTVSRESQIQFTGTDLELVANCFNKDVMENFWNSFSLDHWYDVDPVTKKAVTTKGINLEIAAKVPKQSAKDPTAKVTFSPDKQLLNSNDYPYIIPSKIAAAINHVYGMSADPNTQEGQNALKEILPYNLIKDCFNTKNNSGSSKSQSINRSINIKGINFEELINRLNFSKN